MFNKEDNHNLELKYRVALEALRGEKTEQEIADRYDIDPEQVAAWKHQAIDAICTTFHGLLAFASEGDSDPVGQDPRTLHAFVSG